ncbi:MAG: efflux RND transporter periplasmic adaptor subunit [Chloroflexota bacterium]
MTTKSTKKGLWLLLVFILLISGGGIGYYYQIYLPSQITDNTPEIQTATVRRGNLILYASGSGTLVLMDEIKLGFGTSGTLAELYVKIGDQVQEGDILAVQGDREELEAIVAADRLAVRNAQRSLDSLYENAPLVAAQAQLDLANAQADLEEAKKDWQYQQSGYRGSTVSVKAAEAELVLAEENLDIAKDKLNDLANLSEDDPRYARAYKNYAAAYQNYQTALWSYNWYTGQPTDTEQAQLDATVALAEANLAEAMLAYERVKDGPDPDEVASAELQLANAEAQLKLSLSNLEQSTIYAPIDGTILEVNADVGDTVSGIFITMADLNNLYVDVYLDETDLDKIELNYEVEVTFDALPDQIFKGHVVQINPSLQISGTVSTIKALAKLDENASLGLTKLLIGMNASVDVIAGRAEQAILVPVGALRELGDGEYAVFVMVEGELKLRPVEVGLTDFTYAEITSGLEVGEVVSTGIVETQ